jgi:hypothetical protein
MNRLLGWVVGIVVILGGAKVYAHAEQVFEVGTIDFFVGQGMDTAALLAELPIKVGQPVNVEQMDELKSGVNAMVLAATDVNVVCCDQPGRVQLYVGLQGRSYRAASYATAPTGGVVLPGDGLVLYQEDSKANEAAVEIGHAQEDDAQGYALSGDAVGVRREVSGAGEGFGECGSRCG